MNFDRTDLDENKRSVRLGGRMASGGLREWYALPVPFNLHAQTLEENATKMILRMSMLEWRLATDATTCRL